MAELSRRLQEHPEAQNPRALERIRLAMRRLASVLPRETVACQKTLEQKISDGGPKPQRIDPHLLGLAIQELLQERKLVRSYTHAATGSIKWYAYTSTPEAEVRVKLDEIAPLYAHITETNFLGFPYDDFNLYPYGSPAPTL